MNLEGVLEGLLYIEGDEGLTIKDISRILKISEEDHITLEPAGLEIAEKIYERHTVLTEMLVKIGVSEKIAAEDACKMEHDISDETFNCIKNHIQKSK